jgi:hypothetical protein
MFICNTTFVMAPEKEQEFLAWMRGEAAPKLFGENSPAKNPRLQTVVEAGGEAPGPDHGLSIALQAEFVSKVMAHTWHDTVLLPVLGDYHKKFGPHAIFFVTLLETLPL